MPRYVNVTASAGINYVQQVHPVYTHVNQLPNQQHFVSGGAAAGDFDGDGWIDLYVTRLDNSDILYRNLRNGKFADVTTSAFGANHLKSIKTNGAAWGDIDNDGDLDLYVTTFETTRHYLYINDGAGHFTEKAIERGVGVPEVATGIRYGFSSCFGDYDRDGYLDIHVTEWRQEGEAVPGQYGRDHPNVRHNTRLLRNRGAAQPGYFDDVTNAAGVATENVPSNIPKIMSSEGLSSRFSDLDHDGHPDLLLVQDHEASRLFWNNGNGTFTDGTAAAGVGFDRFGMGNAVGDFDNDGDLDWFITSIFDDSQYNESNPSKHDGNYLYRNNGDRTFTDVTIAANVLKGGWGWATMFMDYDNDGDLDLFMTNGIDVILENAQTTLDDPYENDPSILWQNNGNGSFTNISIQAGIVDTAPGKGALSFDYDNDGDLDIFIVNNGLQPILYRNDGGNASKWLRLKLEGVRSSNRQAIGAFVKITPDLSKPSEIQVREVDGGNNYLGQNETTLHFGVGQATRIDEVRIEWPDGEVSLYSNVATNVLHNIKQPGRFAEVEGIFGKAGEAFSYQIETSYPANSYAAVGLPAGLVVDAQTGAITGSATEIGSFTIEISANFDGSIIATSTVGIFRSTYGYWAAQRLGAELGQSSLAAPSDDFDKDGRSNFQEYAENTDPKVWDIGSRYVFVELEGETYFGLQYTVPNYASDVVAFPQQAQVFGAWSAAVAVPPNSQNVSPNLFDVATVRRSKPIDELPGGFLRVLYSNVE